MNQSILVGKRAHEVYSKDLLSRLARSAGLESDEIVTKEMLEANPEFYRNTEYIFATWGMFSLTGEEIERYLPSLRAVFYGAGTVQKFARPFLERGIPVFSAWAANAIPVAEYTVSQILLATKGYFGSARIYKETKDKKSAARYTKHFPGNYGANIGLVGCGMIGSMVAERLQSFRLNVKVYDPFLSPEKASRLKVTVCSLEELFSTCTVVSNHTANLPATVGMMQGTHFASMLPYATFINTGRGAQLAEPEMIAVLSERTDLTAVLDVTFPEPPEADSPLYTLPNVILTPHIAGSMGDEVERMGEYMEEEFLAYRAGEPTRYSVSLKMLETMA